MTDIRRLFRCDALGVVAVLALSGQLHAQDVYKSVDAQGHVTYSDHADAPNAQRMDVTPVEGNASEAARLAQQQRIENDEEARRKSAQAHADQAQQQADEEKQRRCAAARLRYAALKDVNRVYNVDSAGNRVYLSDAEADTQRSQAQQAVQAACGT